jgi:hypothetical protein
VGFGPLISSVKSPVRSRHTLTTEQNRLQLPSYIQTFGISRGEKVSDGGNGFLLGVLAILVVFAMVNRGQIVVNCVVNLVNKQSLLWSLKLGHYLKFF